MKGYSVKKVALIILGTISLFLGAIGIFLPILPTTPFLLLTALCYLRSSKRLYNWLTEHSVFGSYIYSYMTYKAVTRGTKIGALTFLWFTLIISIFLINSLYVRLLLAAVGVGVSIHLMTLKTLRPEDMKISRLSQEEQ